MSVIRAGQFRALAGDGVLELSSSPAEWSHSFGENGRFRMMVANDIETRSAAYRLVYRLYLEKGYTEPNESEMWLSLHSLLPDTMTLLVLEGEELVGALTAVFDNPLGLPGDILYRDEIDALRRDGRRPAEIISLGVAEKDKRTSGDILVNLFYHAYLVSRFLRSHDDFVITVNPHHAPYYVRMMLFEELGGEKTYDKVAGAPAMLLRLDLRKAAARYKQQWDSVPRKRNFYGSFHTPERELKVLLSELRRQLTPMSDGEFYFFAMGETDLWERASKEAKTYLAEFYLSALMGLRGTG